MKLGVFLSDTVGLAACATILSIDENDGARHVVVVPDRFSLLAEKMVIDNLGKNATFYTEVTGISGMCQKFLEKEKLEGRLLSSVDKILLIKESISCVKLNAFRKVCSAGFAREMLSTIDQLKSSGVYPKDLSYKGNSKSLKNKLEDVRKIYEKYEELRGDKLDAGALLSLFEEEIFNLPEFKNVKFYFVGFDSLPKTGFEILSKLARCCAEVAVAAPYGDNPNNSYIYENDLYEKIKKIATRDGVEIEASFFKAEEESSSVAQLKNNLFGRVVEGKRSSYARIIEADNREEEVLFLAKNIKYNLVTKGARFRDYNVAVSNVDEYKSVIERVFRSFGISYHIDIERKLAETIVARFVLATVKMIEEKMSVLEVFKVLDFPFLGIDNESINKLKSDSKEKSLHRLVIEEFKNRSALDILCENKDSIFSYAKMIGETVSLQEEAVIYESFDKTFEILSNLTKKNIDSAELYELLTFCFDAEKVVSKPESSDCVYIGDATKSFFEERDRLFVLGASADELPSVMSDAGLFSDRDISKLKDSFDLEPTIKMMNRRARFKLFGTMLLGKEELSLLYVSVKEGKRVIESQIVTDVENMFGVKRLKTSEFSKIRIDDKNIMERFLFNLGSRASAEESLYTESENPYVVEMKGSLHYSLNCEEFGVEEENLERLKDFALKNNRTRVTQLESFFKCPYSHFLSYALNLKEVKEAKLDAGKFGNFMHKIAEGIVRGESVQDIIEKSIKTDPEFKYLPEGSLDLIIKDGLRLEKDIKDELELSGFVPTFIEEGFEGTLGKYKLVGRVDRIDTKGESYRIIDYKTGKSQSILKELYYGEKLQLFIYDSLVKNRLKKESEGVFYFNANYKYDNKPRGDILNGVQDSFGGSIYAGKMAEMAISEIENGNIKKSPIKGECKYCKYKGICSFNGSERKTNKKITEESFSDKV